MSNRIWISLLFLFVLFFSASTVWGLVDINTATVEELQTLPQIGPALAQSIVDYRTTHGPFKSTSDIMKVPKIGEKTYEKIKMLVTVGGEKRRPQSKKEDAKPALDISKQADNLEKMESIPAKKQYSEEDELALMALFEKEPSIQEVQKAAVMYAEIDPLRYARWRQQVRMRAFIPETFQITVGHDTDDDTDYDRSKTISLSGGTVTLGPDDETWKHSTDDDWDYEIKMKWNFQDYFFDSDMLRINSETQDQIEFRQDILNEVTKLYYDRRRLIIDMKLNPPEDIQARIDQKIRLDEITANLDALTNGFFLKNIQQKSHWEQKNGN